MKTILLPTDFSDNASNAIEYALTFFKNEPTKFVMVNTFEIPHAGTEVLVSVDDMLKEEAKESLSEQIKTYKENPAYSNYEFEPLCKDGDLVDVIDEYVQENKVDMVVMGTKGASGIQEVLVGSNTSGVIQSVMAPVLAVPEKSTFKAPKKIVFASDLKEISDDGILQPVKDIAIKYESEVFILNVVTDDEKDHTDEAVQGLRLEHIFEDIQHSFHFVESKKIVEGIHQFLNEKDADFLTMIPRRNNFFDRIFHKSVTNKMVYHTHIPLLALHDIRTIG